MRNGKLILVFLAVMLALSSAIATAEINSPPEVFNNYMAAQLADPPTGYVSAGLPCSTPASGAYYACVFAKADKSEQALFALSLSRPPAWTGWKNLGNAAAFSQEGSVDPRFQQVVATPDKVCVFTTSYWRSSQYPNTVSTVTLLGNKQTLFVASVIPTAQPVFYDFVGKAGTYNRYLVNLTISVAFNTDATVYIGFASSDEGRMWHTYRFRPKTGDFLDVTPESLPNVTIHDVRPAGKNRLLLLLGQEVWLVDLAAQSARNLTPNGAINGDVPEWCCEMVAAEGTIFLRWMTKDAPTEQIPFGLRRYHVWYVMPDTLSIREIIADDANWTKVSPVAASSFGGIIGDQPFATGGLYPVPHEHLWQFRDGKLEMIMKTQDKLFGLTLGLARTTYIAGGIATNSVTMDDNGNVTMVATMNDATKANSTFVLRLTPPPALKEARPTSVQTGQDFVLDGTNFTVPGATTEVYVGSYKVPCSGTTSLTCSASSVPAGDYNISVKLVDSKGKFLQSNNTLKLTVTAPPPPFTGSLAVKEFPPFFSPAKVTLQYTASEPSVVTNIKATPSTTLTFPSTPALSATAQATLKENTVIELELTSATTGRKTTVSTTVYVVDPRPSILVVGSSWSQTAPSIPTTSPCQWMTVWGNRLALYEATAPGIFFKSLGNTSVKLVSGSWLDYGNMSYVSPTQVNFQVPCDGSVPTTGQMQVTLTVDGRGVSEPFTLNLAPASPDFLAYQGRVFVQNPDGSTNSVASPVESGKWITLYAIGMGYNTTPPMIATAGTPVPVDQYYRLDATGWIFQLGGKTGQVDFAGFAPNWVGLYQINLVLPELPSGTHSGTLTIGGVNYALTISVK